MFLKKAKKIAPELACYYANIAEQEFNFRGSDPLTQSNYNLQELILQEYYAKKDPRIDLQFRKEAIEYIFKRWKKRLKNFQPYRQQGFRLYAYYENVPGISVVAETSQGCPFSDRVVVDQLDDVLGLTIKAPKMYEEILPAGY